MKRKLLLFPCNGNAIEALEGAEGWEVLGFVDDDPKLQGKKFHGFDVFGREAFGRFPGAQVIAAPGSPVTFAGRAELIGGLALDPARFATLVHPSARVSSRARLGRNVVIMAGVVVGAGASVGNHVCILPNSVVHHDASVGDFTLIGSLVAIAGYARVGRGCYVGSGSTLIQRIEIGDGALVGMGANVIRRVAAGRRVAGNPAREIVRDA